jgi:hypothetical protein
MATASAHNLNPSVSGAASKAAMMSVFVIGGKVTWTQHGGKHFLYWLASYKRGTPPRYSVVGREITR